MKNTTRRRCFSMCLNNSKLSFKHDYILTNTNQMSSIFHRTVDIFFCVFYCGDGGFVLTVAKIKFFAIAQILLSAAGHGSLSLLSVATYSAVRFPHARQAVASLISTAQSENRLKNRRFTLAVEMVGIEPTCNNDFITVLQYIVYFGFRWRR